MIGALLAGCAHVPTEHVCNYKQLVSGDAAPPHGGSGLRGQRDYSLRVGAHGESHWTEL